MRRLLLLLVLLAPLTLSAGNRRNPVLRGVADAGVIRWAGKYYLGGVGTNGDFFVSPDLIHWDERIHVFDLDNEWTHGTGAGNNQIHSDDISYSNGLFHLLFSANYWGSDRHLVHTVHAVSPTVTGPYREPRKDQWFENRIDPQVFRDEDGRLYLYLVKFTDGNVIWAREMQQDFTFSGEPFEQFSSQPGTWETEDSRVAEGPFVIKYRGRYYMMYNANHTDPSYGHYQLGVCESPDPLSFNSGGKYSHPVLGPNTDTYTLTGEEHLLTPGQPNLVRGPNGWEWWLSYMANNDSGRHQFVDQIFFVADRLTVDGITGTRTPGYHPTPSLPQMSGNSTEQLTLADHFLLELTFSSPQKKQGIALGGRKIVLPEEMSGVTHEWRIEKNAGLLTVHVDHILLLDHVKVGTTKGKKVKWIGNLQDYDIQYVQYTEGWDEWGPHFSGWGDLTADKQGLQLPKADLLKGDGAKDFSFSVLLRNDELQSGTYGIQAAADEENSVRASIDAKRLLLVIDSRHDGIPHHTEHPLSVLEDHYPAIPYSDFQEQQYRFPCLTETSLLQLPAGKAETVKWSWLDRDTWREIQPTVTPAEEDQWENVQFPTIRTTAIRTINADPRNYDRPFYRIRTRRDFKADYQLRMEKEGPELHLFVDNREVALLTVKDSIPWRAGLFSDGAAPVRVSNTLWYHIERK